MYKLIKRAYLTKEEIYSQKYDPNGSNSDILDEFCAGCCFEIIEKVSRNAEKYKKSNLRFKKAKKTAYDIAFFKGWYTEGEICDTELLYKIKKFANEEAKHSGWGNTSMLSGVRFRKFFTDDEKTSIMKRIHFNTINTHCKNCEKNFDLTDDTEIMWICKCGYRFCDECKKYPRVKEHWCNHCCDNLK